MKTYDAIIIGTGQAGTPLALKLASAGWQVAVIEKQWPGGTCVNTGCTPTKTLIASGKVAWMAAHAAEWGINVPDYSVDMPAVKKRKDEIVTTARGHLDHILTKASGVNFLYGAASFEDRTTVRVALNNGGTEQLSAPKIFINTGAKTAIPDIKGLSDIPYLTSATIQELEAVPEHLLIVGASYVALEFGQLYRRLESKVTILEKSETFLSKEDDDIADAMKQILEEDGITLHIAAEVLEFTQHTGNIGALLRIPGGEKICYCSHVLVASGRPPQIEGLQLEKADVETDEHGAIRVNEYLETNVPGIYALGDVKGGPAFTHISYNDFVIVWKNLLFDAKMSTKDRLVPYVMFTDPQLARIGITEKEAKQKGLSYKVAKLEMKHVARARETGEMRGLMKAVVDTATKKILGVAILGVDGGEMMAVLQMAMMGDITYDQLSYAVFAHPTLAESFNNLFSPVKD
ncbi:mercuric reductase [Chitinophagaceae bacterium MMS25-I14]